MTVEVLTSEPTTRPIVEPVAETIKKKIEYLASECSDADQVATFLLNLNLKGVPGDGRDCPLANWLRMFGVTDAVVGSRYIMALETVDKSHFPTAHQVILPEHVSLFVQNFDQVRYPALIG